MSAASIAPPFKKSVCRPQRKAGSALRDLIKATRQSGQRYRSLFDLSPSGILLEDLEGNILEANPAMCRIFGYTHDELCGANVKMLVPPDLWGEVDQHLEALNSGKKLLHEVENVGKDGRRLRVEVHEMSVPLSDGRMGILAIVHDITERRRLEEQLRHLQKMESVGQLAAGIAHDFNNILTVINCGATVLSELLADRPECLEWVGQIAESGERAANLTRQLLLFSRKQQMRTQLVNLNELTSNLTKMLGRILGEQILLEFSYENDLPAVQADPSMMEQVILNLAVNARDAMPKGGRLHIATSTVPAASVPQAGTRLPRPGILVRLTVHDTGVGIAPEIRERIFEPFFTTKDVGKGTGLGLATVFGIVTQHDGWIEVGSPAGCGTIFHIYLPACGDAVFRTAHSSAGIAAVGKGETILVVEDDPAVRELMQRTLGQYGYQVLTANSGCEALQATRSELEKVDLLVTDLMMPGEVNGRELAKSLQEEFPRLRVIICSGYSPEMANAHHTDGEEITFIKKPFVLHDFLKTIAGSLQS